MDWQIQQLVAKGDALSREHVHSSSSSWCNDTQLSVFEKKNKNKPRQLPIRHALIGRYNTFLLYSGIRRWQVAAAMCTQSTYPCALTASYQGMLRSEHRKAFDGIISNSTVWGLQKHLYSYTRHASAFVTSSYIKPDLFRAPWLARPAQQPVAQHPPCTEGPVNRQKLEESLLG